MSEKQSPNSLLYLSRLLKLCLWFDLALWSQLGWSQIELVKTIEGKLSPKSVVHNGEGVFAVQNMMYRHTVAFYDASGELLSRVKDEVDLNRFGYTEYQSGVYKGGPVEACFSADKKYLWVSNYAMSGKGFTREGCDGCTGKDYDPSFLYKINVSTFKIENVIRVGSVPKYLNISKNGRLLLVSNWTSSDVSIIDLDHEKEIKRVDVGMRPRGIAIDKNNQFAYVTIMGSDKVAKLNLLTYQVTYINGVGRSPRHVLMNKANTVLYISVNSTNRMVRYNLFSGQLSFCKVNAGPRTMILAPDESAIYVVNYYSNTFQKINTKTFKVVETVPTQHHPIGITANWPTGEIWVSCYKGVIQIFKDKTLKKKAEEVEVAPITRGKAKLMTQIPVQRIGSFEAYQVDVQPVPDYCDYYIVVGSFADVANIEAFEASLKAKGYQTERIKSVQNMTMLSVGHFKVKSIAVQALGTVQEALNPAAWIYQKQCL